MRDDPVGYGKLKPEAVCDAVIEVQSVELVDRADLAVFIERHHPIIGIHSWNNAVGTGKEGSLWDVVVHEICRQRSEEHTSELQSLAYLVCRLLLEKKN